jgi:lactoylglutathione lyase
VGASTVHLAQVAIWAQDLERLRSFYEHAFGAQAGAKYRNERKQFESYFLALPSGGRLELMQRADIRRVPGGPDDAEFFGYAHLGVSVGSPAAVDALTARLAAEGVRVLDGPRLTGDGYYESLIMDPEGNRILILAS